LVLLHRFALISSIETTVDFIGLGKPTISVADQKCYRDMWAMLAGMPNLKRIRISVAAYKCSNPLPDDLKEVWLGPLKQLGDMEVLVPESYARHFRVDNRLKFALKTFCNILCPVTCHAG
jgi:hypothetical protein